MRLSISIKILLAVVLLAGVGAIVYSFLSRSAPKSSARPPSEILPADIERKTTAFESVEVDQGRKIYRVKAASTTVTASGVNDMEGVELMLFKEDGVSFDRIEGKRARYSSEAKEIDFSQEVAIQLAEGTLIRCRQAHADLDRRVIRIAERFEFRRGDATGNGGGLIYSIGDKRLDVQDFQVVLPGARHPIRASSAKAVYDLAGQTVWMSAKARVSGGPDRMDARDIRIEMNQERRLKRIEASGSASYRTGQGQSFSGDRIVNVFDPAAKRWTSLDVFSGPGSDPRAVYERIVAGGAQHLEADRIAGTPVQESPEEFRLDLLEATGNVVFSAAALAIREARSGRLTARFDPATGEIREASLHGVSSIDRQVAEDERQLLRGGGIDLTLLPGSRFERAAVAGPASAEFFSAAETKSLTAQGGLRIGFVDGLIGNLDAVGGTRFEFQSAQERNSVAAPELHALFEGGLPKRIHAQGGVEVQMGTQSSDSRELVLEYRKGVLEEARQEGRFQLSDTQAGIELKTDRAVYDPPSQTLRAGGDAGGYPLRFQADPAQPASRTRADGYVLDRLSGKILAEGRVSTVFENPEREVKAQAGRMSIERSSNRILFEVQPVIDLQSARIWGDSALISSAGREILVDGNVRSTFRAAGQESPREFSIEAWRLQFDPASELVHYTGEVRLRTEGLDLQAPSVDIRIPPGSGSGLTSLEAWGGVHLTADKRQAEGDRATYRPDGDTLTIVGRPAKLIDPEEGTITAPQLTFSLRDDSLHVVRPIAESKP